MAIVLGGNDSGSIVRFNYETGKIENSSFRI